MSHKRSNKCRTCLKLNAKLLPLNTKPKMTKIDKTYSELLSQITQIEFRTDDENKMPQEICLGCSKKIRDSYSFIKQVRNCNNILLTDTIHMMDDDPTSKLEETAAVSTIYATEKGILDANEDLPSIKQELNPFDDEMDEPKNELPHEVWMASDDIVIKTETIEPAKEEQVTELFPECVLKENIFSDDDSFSDKDFIKDDDGDDDDEDDDNDDDYDPLQSSKHKKRAAKEFLDDEKNLPVPCEDCGRVFQNASQLNRHKKSTHLPDELKMKCPNCPSKFNRLHHMHTHMRTVHKMEPVSEPNIQIGKVKKKVTCEHCQKTYCNKYKLREHVKSKHGPNSHLPKPEKVKQPEKRFLCTLCGFTCHTQPYLDVHYRRHTGDKPFKCDYCDRSFYRMHDVQMHHLSHTGEKPFKCTVCEKAFRRSSKLTIHMRTHTNERPYKCNMCDKAFKQSKDLTVHRRIHTGERPYKCNVCESTFTQSNSLRLHQQKTKHIDVTGIKNNNNQNSSLLSNSAFNSDSAINNTDIISNNNTNTDGSIN